MTREGEEWRIEVADTGTGIPESDQSRIFDRFYRADKARTRAAGGSGLGLSIARWIAGLHSGTLELVSSTPAGTTFRLTLPAA
jgi:signal transduction histidine kinase